MSLGKPEYVSDLVVYLLNHSSCEVTRIGLARGMSGGGRRESNRLLVPPGGRD